MTGTSGLFDKAVVDRAACGLGCDLGLFDKKATDWRAVGSEHLSGPSFAVVVGGSGAGLWGYVYSARHAPHAHRYRHGYRPAKGNSLVLSAKGTRKPRSVRWVFFRREVPSAPGALLVTWVELTVR